MAGKTVIHRSETGRVLSNYANPVNIWCVRASNTRDGDGVSSCSAEARQLYAIILVHIFIPIVPAQRKANGLRGSSVHADRCDALVAAAHVVNLAIDVVKEHCLCSFGRANVGDRYTAVRRSTQVADFVR